MIETSGIKAIVTDIEGTTSSLTFVKDVLFPYARDHIPAYVKEHEAEIGAILDEVRAIEGRPDLTADDIVPIFQTWIAEDRKVTPLKTLQGMVWKAGFESGAFKGHIYDDAADALQTWAKAGLTLCVYSSGSVAAQKLLYGHSERGDLTPLFSGYFDTVTGPKLDADSYAKIAGSLDLAPEEILFLSDHTGEIDAAEAAGLRTVLLDREGDQPADTRYRTARTFADIQVTG